MSAIDSARELSVRELVGMFYDLFSRSYSPIALARCGIEIQSRLNDSRYDSVIEAESLLDALIAWYECRILPWDKYGNSIRFTLRPSRSKLKEELAILKEQITELQNKLSEKDALIHTQRRQLNSKSFGSRDKGPRYRS